jgi:CspA family cold shock protein
MPQGTIKKLTEKGYGFIDTGHGDLFFHLSALEDGTSFEQLQIGQGVEYEEGQGPKGPRAESVRII